MSRTLENTAPFLRSMNAQERQHALLDLDRVSEKQMSADDFLAKYGIALRTLLDPSR